MILFYLVIFMNIVIYISKYSLELLLLGLPEHSPIASDLGCQLFFSDSTYTATCLCIKGFDTYILGCLLDSRMRCRVPGFQRE